MKKLVEVEKSGIESLMGKVITLFCCRYIYTGKLVGVSDDCVELQDPSIVYETGAFDKKEWADAQRLPHKTFFVARQAIESFGLMK